MIDYVRMIKTAQAKFNGFMGHESKYVFCNPHVAVEIENHTKSMVIPDPALEPEKFFLFSFCSRVLRLDCFGVPSGADNLLCRGDISRAPPLFCLASGVVVLSAFFSDQAVHGCSLGFCFV